MLTLVDVGPDRIVSIVGPQSKLANSMGGFDTTLYRQILISLRIQHWYQAGPQGSVEAPYLVDHRVSGKVAQTAQGGQDGRGYPRIGSWSVGDDDSQTQRERRNSS